jgi:phosphatidylglycerophosphate synthase
MIGSAVALVIGLTSLVLLVRPFDARPGLATGVTFVRFGLVLGLGVAAVLGVEASVGLIALCVVEMILDGIDGPLARRRGEASAFGARLDGEVDALFVLVLSLLAWRRDEGPGPLVLAVGALRYAMAAAAFLSPRLRGQVPSSLRAKIICDAAIVALLLCLLPLPVPAWPRTALVGLALASLVYSFSFDVRYLLARPATRS